MQSLEVSRLEEGALAETPSPIHLEMPGVNIGLHRDRPSIFSASQSFRLIHGQTARQAVDRVTDPTAVSCSQQSVVFLFLL